MEWNRTSRDSNFLDNRMIVHSLRQELVDIVGK